VLVVDDDADLRALAEIQLGERFEVLTADSGSACLELAAEKAPDVILLDMMMPGMDGAEVLTRLAEHPATKDIPVIFLSALTATEDRVRGLDTGAIDFISKPANPSEFIARVSAAARIKAKQETLKLIRNQDPVTGLPDRQAFDERMVQEGARARRMGSALTVMIIDIDQMDAVNDAVGRNTGDGVPRRIAEVLTTTLRASDIVFRYGGDEFAAILPDSGIGSAYLAAERCREKVHSLTVDGTPITCSIGIAELSAGRSTEELLAKAEIALFRAKESGGDRCWRADDPRRHGMSPAALAEELTEREWMILRLLADKRTEQDIARRMGIRPGTVRSHKARIRRKLNVSAEMRLSEFVRDNFRDLIARIGDLESLQESIDT
ncbi:MAG: diguanylate cyclase domain-containing protein, partial [Actinomycetota bacterium]